MKKTHKIFLLTVPLVLLTILAKAQYFADYQLNYIQTFTDTLLSKLDRFSDFSDDGIAISEDYINYFLDLFDDPVTNKIFNDITGKPKYISPVDYTLLIKKLYPKGIATKFLIDSALYSLPQQINDTTFYIFVKVPKFIAGKNVKNTLLYNHYIAYIKVIFNYSNYNFSNFKIANIQRYLDVKRKISNEKMRGLYLSLSNQTYSSVFQLSPYVPNYFRKPVQQPNTNFTANLVVFFNSHLSLKTGIGVGIEQYAASASYNNSQNTQKYYDADSDLYYLYINSNISEKIQLYTLLLPVGLSYKTGFYNKTGLYLSAGIITKYLFKSYAYVTGTSSRQGYYPEYHLLISDLPSYGFGYFTYNNQYQLPINQLIFSPFIAIGIIFPLKKGYLSFNSFYSRTLSNLGYNRSVYIDDYIALNGQPSTAYFANFGISVSYYFKL